MRDARNLLKDTSGATAIEYALLALPFFLLVLAVLEVALIAFVNTSLDVALRSASREVRIGRATAENWDLARFKHAVCDGMRLYFGCDENLLVTTKVMSDFSSATIVAPDISKSLSISESFAPGSASDFMLVQAYLPWNSFLANAGVRTRTLPDGRYVLASAALFRNEPFE